MKSPGISGAFLLPIVIIVIPAKAVIQVIRLSFLRRQEASDFDLFGGITLG